MKYMLLIYSDELALSETMRQDCYVEFHAARALERR